MKDIMTRAIPGPNPEPALADANLGHTAFAHFVDDDSGGADTLDVMLDFLMTYYFLRLFWANIRLNPAKAFFACDYIKVLGHARTTDRIRPSASKITTMMEWPTPSEPKEVERFLASLPFLKAYIPGRADITRILKTSIITKPGTAKDRTSKTVKKKLLVDLVWTKQHQKVFKSLKKAICENCVAAGDEDKQYHLCCNASKTGLGGVLYQIVNNKESVICFLSYQLTEAQSRWHTTEREAFAVYKCLDECSWLLLGSKFPVRVYTDHSALLSVLRADNPHGRICRWQLFLARFDLEYTHVPRKDLAIADGLSRFNKVASSPRESANAYLSCKELGYTSEEEMDVPALMVDVAQRKWPVAGVLIVPDDLGAEEVLVGWES